MSLKHTILCCFLWLGLIAFGQSEKQFLKAGNEAFEAGDYYEAIAYFDNALKFNKNADAIYKIAMSYYTLKDYENALPYFNKVENAAAFPLLFFYQGSNYKLLGKYDDAIARYNDFLLAYPIPGFYRDKAQQEIASCYWAKDQKQDAQVIIKHFEKPLNTGYSEFAATYLDSNTIQVSSLQSITKNLKSDFQSKIYFYDIEGKKTSASEDIIFPIDRDDSLDYANGFYFKEKQEFYYSQCYTEHELGEKICDIYKKSFQDNTWGEAVPLSLNTKDFTETQAHVVLNAQGETEIYFVSDRTGGKGKLDIWKAIEIAPGQYSEAINLPGNINSIDNESTPHFDVAKQCLYFSSEWHYGFGGYDIFKSDFKQGEWREAENLGAPINSSANDQYYAPSGNNKALLASNRKGALQLRGSACCFDIYEHHLAEANPVDSLLLTLEDLSSNASNSNEIKGAFAALQEAIPVTVYFHNDEPNPKSTATKTSLSYADCYASYQKVKPLYFEEFEDDPAITQWFATVDESYNYLNSFLSILSNVLAEQEVTLQIEGYCSPLALNDYNINLAKRRIVNLENYILAWNDGLLQKYYNKGQLKFTSAPFGEEKAQENVSDSFEDIKQSIYNPNAAVERRVAIIAVF